MDNILIGVVDKKFTPLYEAEKESILFKYPCPNTYECTEYNFTLPPGRYKFEAYGGSAGSHDGRVPTAIEPDRKSCMSQDIVDIYKGNTICQLTSSSSTNLPGAGGYMSGIITLKRRTKVFAAVAGKGEYSNQIAPRGGYNGGGNAKKYSTGSAAGGGATDIRFEKNDVFHRVLVAGGGGGTDDNQGAGGCGGYEDAQGFWIASTYYSNPVASQLYGFSFGQGESAGPKTSHTNSTSNNHVNDIAGAGGGWFGGFCSRHDAGGAGGGSSFILKEGAKIPSGTIVRHDGRYQFVEQGEYAFKKNEYLFENFRHAKGIWGGNGQIKITLISKINAHNACTKTMSYFHFSSFLFTIILSK